MPAGTDNYDKYDSLKSKTKVRSWLLTTIIMLGLGSRKCYLLLLLARAIVTTSTTDHITTGFFMKNISTTTNHYNRTKTNIVYW